MTTSNYAFIGPAGSGKTHSLIEKLKECCGEREFLPFQSLLAITFMHGSRRRLASKIDEHIDKEVRVCCETIDSFCLRLVNRYRLHLNRRKKIVIADDQEEWAETPSEFQTCFTEIRAAAVRLLQNSDIRLSVAAAYPIVLVDEFQDCHGDLLAIVKLLSQQSSVLVAADEFQDLRSTGTSMAFKWLRESSFELTELSRNHRTKDDRLLTTAHALRDNVAATSSIEIIPQSAAGLVAYGISSRIAWGKVLGSRSKVIISPSRPESSPWLKGTLGSLAKELGKKTKIPPCPFGWEDSDKEKVEITLAVADTFADSENGFSRNSLRSMLAHEDRILRRAATKANRLVSLRGSTGMAVDEMQKCIQLTAHSMSAYQCETNTSRIGMTVYGAKNREFDFVFILWPYQVVSDSIQKRKLLYNAVTRAKKGAILFVQGDDRRVETDSVLSLLKCGIKSKSQQSRRKAV